ncbi:uncharacterized protein LOC142771371 [Rhipicephalus microplus]|uniref:uncharacterized protein LOC142771371 n=1 Tax=Rhipicephalus microplus TaxID=6941 RepID=UPI003F6D327E
MLPATAYRAYCFALALAVVFVTSGDALNGTFSVSVKGGYCVLNTTSNQDGVVKIKDGEIFGGVDPCMSYVCLADKKTVVTEGCVPLETRGPQCRTEPGRKAAFPACCPVPLCDYEPGTSEAAPEGGRDN